MFNKFISCFSLGYLNKTLIKTEIVSNGILPTLFVLPIVRKVPHDVLVDAIEGESFLGAVSDRHHYKSVIAVGRFVVGFLLLICKQRRETTLMKSLMVVGN